MPRMPRSIGRVGAGVHLVALQVLPTGHGSIRDAISDYGVGRYCGYFCGNLLPVAWPASESPWHCPACIRMCRPSSSQCSWRTQRPAFLMPAFPTDQSGSRFQTAKGTVRMLLAFVAFGAVAAAATSPNGLFSHYPEWMESRVSS